MMIRLILVMLMSSFILTGCQFDGQSKDFSTRQPLEMGKVEINNTFILEGIRLVGLGDSLTQGVGDELKKGGYLGRLSTKMATFNGVLSVQLGNEAKRGKRSDQLLSDLQSGKLKKSIKSADVIVITIGGNDIMRIVKQNIFQLRVDAFQKELLIFANRYGEILKEIRLINPNSPIIILGLYNPLTMVTDEANEFDQIMIDWNQTINTISHSDINACFVPVDDLFNSNTNMVYHTDFFHPNSKGYDLMTNRIIETLKTCGLDQLTNGEMDF